MAKLHAEQRELLIVSSGAIALGRSILKLPKGALKLDDSQAAAAVGQIELARTWSEALRRHGISSGQILVTLGDTEERQRYLNARSTITRLLEWRAVPVINENDTVATSEIRYGDNDRLAARVATMVSADLLVLLSDVDGLYDAPPGSSANAKLIPIVERITPQIENMAGGSASELSRGGMQTKIEAGKIATTGGTHMVIASGRIEHPLQSIAEGGPLHLVSHAGKSGDVAQEMDRRLARAARHVDDRRRCGCGAAQWPQPVAGRRDQGRGKIYQRRCRRRARSRRRRNRPRAQRLRRRGCRQDQGPLIRRHRCQYSASAAAAKSFTATIS